MSSKSPLINVIDSSVRKASKLLVRDFFELEQLQSNVNSNSKFIEKATARTIEIISSELIKLKSEFSISLDGLSNIYSGASDYRFLIKPIDGLINFERSNHYFAIVILVENQRSKEITTAYVNAPILRATYFSEINSGSWVESDIDYNLNSRRMRVSQIANLKKSLISISDNSISCECLEARLIGCDSITGVMVADGKLDAALFKNDDFISKNCNALIVKEAGGFLVNNHRGSNYIISNSALSSNYFKKEG